MEGKLAIERERRYTALSQLVDDMALERYRRQPMRSVLFCKLRR